MIPAGHWTRDHRYGKQTCYHRATTLKYNSAINLSQDQILMSR